MDAIEMVQQSEALAEGRADWRVVAAGLALSFGAVWIWGGQGFGRLQPAETLRWVIPGALCLVLGCQMILTSFFLGVLRLDTRTDAA